MCSFCNQESKPMIEVRAKHSMTVSNAFTNNPLRSGLVRPAGSQAGSQLPPLPVLPPPSPQGRLTVVSLWTREAAAAEAGRGSH